MDKNVDVSTEEKKGKITIEFYNKKRKAELKVNREIPEIKKMEKKDVWNKIFNEYLSYRIKKPLRYKTKNNTSKAIPKVKIKIPKGYISL